MHDLNQISPPNRRRLLSGRCESLTTKAICPGGQLLVNVTHSHLLPTTSCI